MYIHMYVFIYIYIYIYMIHLSSFARVSRKRRGPATPLLRLHKDISGENAYLIVLSVINHSNLSYLIDLGW